MPITRRLPSVLLCMPPFAALPCYFSSPRRITLEHKRSGIPIVWRTGPLRRIDLGTERYAKSPAKDLHDESHAWRNMPEAALTIRQKGPQIKRNREWKERGGERRRTERKQDGEETGELRANREQSGMHRVNLFSPLPQRGRKTTAFHR